MGRACATLEEVVEHLTFEEETMTCTVRKSSIFAFPSELTRVINVAAATKCSSSSGGQSRLRLLRARRLCQPYDERC